MKTCKDFADAFMSKLNKEASGFTEVRLIFDRYLASYLK